MEESPLGINIIPPKKHLSNKEEEYKSQGQLINKK